MNIDFELYRIFYVVANNLNITKAASELNISQPAISKSIKSLEEQLGGQLFLRTTKGVVLTKEGENFYKYIKQAIEFISSAENNFTDAINLETGTIKIGISTTLTKEFLIPYLKTFHKKYPKIKIEIATDTSNVLFTKLRNGLIDIIILNLTDKDYGSDIEIIKTSTITNCFVTSDNSLKNKVLSIKDLNKYPLILQAKPSNAREFIDNFAKKYNTVLKPDIELSSYTLVSEFVKIGFGIGLVTKEYIKNELKNNELYEIKLEEKMPKRHIGIAISKNHLPNFSTKKLIELIKK